MKEANSPLQSVKRIRRAPLYAWLHLPFVGLDSLSPCCTLSHPMMISSCWTMLYATHATIPNSKLLLSALCLISPAFCPCLSQLMLHRQPLQMATSFKACGCLLRSALPGKHFVGMLRLNLCPDAAYSWLHLCLFNEHVLRGLGLCLASGTCNVAQASDHAALGQGTMAAIALPKLTRYSSIGCLVTDSQCLPDPDCAACDAGQGLALAIEDAVVLAWHLRREGLTEKALRRSCLSLHTCPALLCCAVPCQAGPCPGRPALPCPCCVCALMQCQWIHKQDNRCLQHNIVLHVVCI